MNIHVFNALDSLFSSHDTVPQKISSIHILAFASPDGNTAYNEQLAERRATNIKNYLIRKFPHIDTCRIHTLSARRKLRIRTGGVLSTKRRHLPPCGQILYIIDNSNTRIQS
ncbi:MAG: OmpA family protein [Bacteroides stercoris]